MSEAHQDIAGALGIQSGDYVENERTNDETSESSKEETSESAKELKDVGSNELTNESTSVQTLESVKELTGKGLGDHKNEGSDELPNESDKELKNDNSNEPTNEFKRKRFSFDLRPELHRDLKLQCIMDDANMYETVEMLIEQYLNERKNERS